jgi:hypothetical protein
VLDVNALPVQTDGYVEGVSGGGHAPHVKRLEEKAQSAKLLICASPPDCDAIASQGLGSFYMYSTTLLRRITYGYS